ncbi:hypothetical protein KEM48_002549 [Puccinia striiformis f. sp. tritici PST-130]|nr:hypothetical protein KEM48_002549 [Puccinia striiformis f. sp. tritici PST-130]
MTCCRAGLPAGVDPFAYVSHLNSVTWMPPLESQVREKIIHTCRFWGKSLRHTPLPGQYRDYDVHLGISGLHQHPNVSLPANRDTCITATCFSHSIWPCFQYHVDLQHLFLLEHGTWLLTLSYTNKIFVDDSKNLRWLRSPLLINVSFITFPITVAATIAILQTNLCLNFHELQVQLRILQAILSEGSLAWNQFQRTHSSDDQERISFQMAQAWAKADSSAKLFKTIGAPLRDKFLLLRSAMLVSCLLPLWFCLFILEINSNVSQERWSINKLNICEIGLLRAFHENCSIQRRTFARPTPNTKQSFFQTMRSDRQFFRLTMRAFAILLGILTGLTYWLLVSFHIDDVPDWHGFMTWLPALSGSWAAVPLTLQSVLAAIPGPKRPPVSSSEHKEDVIPVHIGQAPEGFTFNHDRLSEIKNLDQTSIS